MFNPKLSCSKERAGDGDRTRDVQLAKLAVDWNLFGIADLIVAVGLEIMTNPGSTQVFYTTPTSVMVTRFPLAVVPTFLVPLAFMLYASSVWQRLGGTWARRSRD